VEHFVEPKNVQNTVSELGNIAIAWSLVVSNLRGAGMSARGIAKKCRMDAQTVSRLQSELQREPRWTQALALLDLHYGLCPEKHSLAKLKLHE
jgi:hypothetical protein